MPDEIIDILLVEDNPDHKELILMVLNENLVNNEVHDVSTAEAALDFLYQRGDYPDAPRPGLILLDIKLPGMNGIELLGAIKGDQHLKSIPVVMLTTSADDRDIVESYGYGANSYVIKPLEYEQFEKTLKQLKIYWLITNCLPD